jgi:REP-associated tyrosine transposase
MKDMGELQQSCRERLEEALATGNRSKDGKWTETIAVGNKAFIEATLKRLGIKAKGRKIVGSKKSYELREPAVPYGGNFTPENGF